jgi:hypothetical protein
LATFAPESAPISVRRAARPPAAITSARSVLVVVRASGSASQITAANAGSTTTAWKATSNPDGRSGR